MDQWLTLLLGGGGLVMGLVGAACAVVVPLAVLGGLAIYLIRRQRKAGVARQAAQAWASTTGTVLMSTVHVRRINTSRSEFPVVMYAYQVNGQAYQGNTVRAGDQFGRIMVYGQARETVARYPPGATVTVYYDPANPATSALER